MSFEVYFQRFGETERPGISRAILRSLSPGVEQDSEPDDWQVRYDAKNFCHIGVTAMASNRES